MKLSNLLFMSLCVGTLLVQFFLNLGYQKPYQEHLAFAKNQGAKVTAFPSEDIKVVLARGLTFTVYGSQKQQGFTKDTREAGVSFAMKGDTLLITPNKGVPQNTYYKFYFRQIPTLVLDDAHANVIAKSQADWQVYVKKQGSLLVEQSSFENLNAVVSDTSSLHLRADAKINALTITLKDKSNLTDDGANLKTLKCGYVSDSAKINLSGKNIRAFVQ